ncbi:MAG: hypothetical protein NDI94_01320, partial [Candidatus Woesearchaeota archaeon]|nr:hypothetical protein [Candidatus Woesearchaeota archaeon]
MIPFDANEQIKAALDQIASENIYTDIHFLGEGGTSQVFGCKKGKEDLVLKLVHPKFPFFEPYSPIALEVIFKQDITYFEQEINFNHTLYHPGFFGMYDYGIVNYTFPIKSEVPYLVFPRYYETFEDVILSDKSFGTKLRQLIRLCDPLIYLHENGFAYRDLKPDNVPMVKGLSFLSDFGCVYNLSDHAPIIGT